MVVVEGIGLGIHSVLAYLAPLANTLVRGGGCSVFGGWGKCLGVEWDFIFIWDQEFLGMGRSFCW